MKMWMVSFFVYTCVFAIAGCAERGDGELEAGPAGDDTAAEPLDRPDVVPGEWMTVPDDPADDPADVPAFEFRVEVEAHADLPPGDGGEVITEDEHATGLDELAAASVYPTWYDAWVCTGGVADVAWEEADGSLDAVADGWFDRGTLILSSRLRARGVFHASPCDGVESVSDHGSGWVASSLTGVLRAPEGLSTDTELTVVADRGDDTGWDTREWWVEIIDNRTGTVLALLEPGHVKERFTVPPEHALTIRLEHAAESDLLPADGVETTLRVQLEYPTLSPL